MLRTKKVQGNVLTMLSNSDLWTALSSTCNANFCTSVRGFRSFSGRGIGSLQKDFTNGIYLVSCLRKSQYSQVLDDYLLFQYGLGLHKSPLCLFPLHALSLFHEPLLFNFVSHQTFQLKSFRPCAGLRFRLWRHLNGMHVRHDQLKSKRWNSERNFQVPLDSLWCMGKG
jgi:hypothetical protein